MSTKRKYREGDVFKAIDDDRMYIIHHCRTADDGDKWGWIPFHGHRGVCGYVGKNSAEDLAKIAGFANKGSYTYVFNLFDLGAHVSKALEAKSNKVTTTKPKRKK